MNINNFTKFSLATLIAITMSACGGGGSDDIIKDGIKTGVFLDSQVTGMKYSTLTQSGFTDANGAFKYKDNEEVTFKIGGITLGKTSAKGMLSPLDLAGTLNPNDPKVVKMLQFFQSIDDDNNASNGISVSDSIKSLAQSQTADFNDSALDINALLTGLSINTPVTAENAVSHFKKTLGKVINKPDNANEFEIVKGVYQDGDTIFEITPNGLINTYKYNNMNNCINVADINDSGYNIDGLFLTHDEENKRFLINDGSNRKGWKYSDDNNITNVFTAGISSGATLALNDSFLTTLKSTDFTLDNIQSNKCSVLGTSNQFKNVKGVYQYSNYADNNATLQEIIRNTVTHIDENGTIHAYKYDSSNTCLLNLGQNDFNTKLDNESLSKNSFAYNIDGKSGIIEYSTTDTLNNKYSWLEYNNTIEYVGFTQGNGQPNVTDTILNVTDLKYSLTTFKSTLYSDSNISDAICP